MNTSLTRIDPTSRMALACALGALLLAGAGCSSKKYVQSQTAPLVQKTNELDDQSAQNNRNLQDLSERTQQGISKAQQSAESATQSAQNATQAAKQAQGAAQEAVNRADSLSSLISNLDNYKQVGDTSVNFAFNRADLTKDDKAKLDQLGQQLASAKNYILEVTGGADAIGGAQYNYALSQRRADAVVQYLASKFNIPPHKFYLIGIGKDQPVASNSTAAGRAKNRRVEVQVLSNTQQGNQPAQGAAGA